MDATSHYEETMKRPLKILIEPHRQGYTTVRHVDSKGWYIILSWDVGGMVKLDAPLCAPLCKEEGFPRCPILLRNEIVTNLCALL